MPSANGSGSAQEFIRFEHVCKSFEEGDRTRTVLNDLTASVAKGEFIAMIGRSGSGKSTLLNLLAGLDLPSSGKIWIGDACISAMDDRARTIFRRHHIGFVFQFFNLIPTLTVLENVLLTAELAGWRPKPAQDRANRLLDTVGLLDRANVFPDKLSGGEQQRIAIARALCADPQVILADEPTGNLDADTGATVLDLLVQLAREHGKTLLMVTHSTDMAAAADRVLKLDHGRLVEMEHRDARPPNAGPAHVKVD